MKKADDTTTLNEMRAKLAAIKARKAAETADLKTAVHYNNLGISVTDTLKVYSLRTGERI